MRFMQTDVVSAPQNWGGLEQKREEASKVKELLHRKNVLMCTVTLQSDVVVAPHNWGGFEQKREESGTSKVECSPKRALNFC